MINGELGLLVMKPSSNKASKTELILGYMDMMKRDLSKMPPQGEPHVISVVCDDGDTIPTMITTQKDIIEFIKDNPDSRLKAEEFKGILSLEHSSWIKVTDPRALEMKRKLNELFSGIDNEQ